MPRPISGPFMALLILSSFFKKQVPLYESEFDEAFDSLTEFLEHVNNERYRLRSSSEGSE